MSTRPKYLITLNIHSTVPDTQTFIYDPLDDYTEDGWERMSDGGKEQVILGAARDAAENIIDISWEQQEP